MFNNSTFRKFSIDSSASAGGNFQKRFNLTVEFLKFLSGLKTEFVFECAVRNIGNKINFYFAVPEKKAAKALNKAKILWGEAKIKPAGGYEIFNPLGSISAFYLEQKMPPVFSIGHRLKSDWAVFLSCLSGFAEVNEVGEGAAIQIICRPAENSFSKSISKIADKISRGTDWRTAINDYSGQISINGGEFSGEDILKSLKFKALHPLFSVNARIIASAPSQFQADEIISEFARGLNPVRKSFFGLKTIKISDAKSAAKAFLFKEFSEKHSMKLNAQELATIFHFPEN